MSPALMRRSAVAHRRGAAGCPAVICLLMAPFWAWALPAYAQTSEGPARLTDGHLGLGGGATLQYDFNNTRTSGIGAISWTWAADRFEAAAFRFLSAQRHDRVPLAESNWTFALSTRLTFLNRPDAKLFFGLGGAYKTETDELNGSRLNFTEQLGWRLTHSEVGRGFEVVIRHMSNAGLKKPNRGQDFLTVAYIF